MLLVTEWKLYCTEYIYGPKSSGVTTLLSAYRSNLLTVKDAFLERKTEYFMFNRPSNNNDDAIDSLSQAASNFLLYGLPTVIETRKAVQQLPSRKTSGANAIPADVYEA